VGTNANAAGQNYAYPNYQQAIPIGLFGVQPPPPNTAPPKVPVQQPIRRSLWEKIPQPEKPATVIKAADLIALNVKTEKQSQDVLEDKTMPDPVRKFIIRGYAKCFTETEKSCMKTILRQIVSGAKNRGEIHTKDWDRMELPKLPRESGMTIPSMITKVGPTVAASLNTIISNPVNIIQTKSIITEPKATPEELKKRSERKTRFASVTHVELSTFLLPSSRFQTGSYLGFRNKRHVY
jgi:hypothetical protein